MYLYPVTVPGLMKWPRAALSAPAACGAAPSYGTQDRRWSTRAAVAGERAFRNRLEGGCQVPIAGYGQIRENQFILTGLVAELDGSRVIKAQKSGRPDSSETSGIELAEELLARGADEILEKLKSIPPEGYES